MKLSHIVVIGLIILAFYQLSKSNDEGGVNVAGAAAFERQLKTSGKPVLAYFWAGW